MSRPRRGAAPAQAMVEFAIALPLLVLLLVAVSDWASIVRASGEAQAAAAACARALQADPSLTEAQAAERAAAAVGDGALTVAFEEAGSREASYSVRTADDPGGSSSRETTHRYVRVTVTRPVSLVFLGARDARASFVADISSSGAA